MFPIKQPRLSESAKAFSFAVAYALAGVVAIGTAVPPGYTVPFFPSAGIALAAVLLMGYRALPAIWVGALAMQFLAGYNASFTGLNWVGASAASTGAVLQAALGGYLTHRLVGWPSPLDRPASVGKFLCLIIPLSCLTSATVAVPCLVGFGGILTEDALFNWFAWWIGDTFGAVIATPILLALFAKPDEDWRGRRLTVALPLLVCVGLIGYGLGQIQRWERHRLEIELYREAAHEASLVQNRLNAQLDMVTAVSSWIGTTVQPERENFRKFVSPLLRRYAGTQNFGWSPRIDRDERKAFERRESSAIAGFQILSRDVDGNTFTSPESSEYLPLTLLEPESSNRRAIGLDVLKLSSTSETVQRARISGQPEATPPFKLVQDRGQQKGVVVYQAIYQNHDANGTPAQLRGVVSSAFLMDDVVKASLKEVSGSILEICLADRSAAPEQQRLFGNPNCENAQWGSEKSFTYKTPLTFAGRNWELLLRPIDSYLISLRNWATWLTICVALTAAGLLGAFLLTTTGNTLRFTHLIKVRTEELGQAQRIARLGSWELNLQQNQFWISDELHRILGHLPRRATLSDMTRCFIAEDRESFQEALASASKSPQLLSLDLHPTPTGDEARVVHMQISSEWQDGRLHIIKGSVQDVTEARAAQANIHRLAHYDSLTGLPNRTLWLTQAKAAIATASRHNEKLAILFLDLDQFKTINDTLGHSAGDTLLQSIAQRLKQSLRSEDLLARLGGDEFVVLLECIRQNDEADTVARKVLARIREPLSLNGHELEPRASIGMALFPEDGDNLETLITHADLAMYSAKESGRNHHQRFRKEMTEKVSQRLTMEASLRKAVERDELVLYFQPQVSSLDNWITGGEALVRWNHPQRGLLLPGEFIPLAEESGLIVQVGAWVMKQTFLQQVAWARLGFDDLQLAINVAAAQLQRPEFADEVLALLNQTGAAANAIEFEITETALVSATPELMVTLNRLREMGITLALDDFGTGYSSLAYLKRMPISRLKIDQSFIHDLPGDPEDVAITTATLSLARDLDMDTVAEGVETQSQREFLFHRGCSFMQGYLFYRPMPAKEFESLLLKQGIAS